MRAFPATGASSPRRTARRASGSEGRESRSPLQARAHEQISMRGKIPEEPADLARGRPTQKPTTSVSEVQPRPALVAEHGRRTREARGAAERGRGQHVSHGRAEGAKASHAARAGLAAGGRALRESAGQQGRCLTVTRTVRSTGRVGGSWVLGPTVGARTWRTCGQETSSRGCARHGFVPTTFVPRTPNPSFPRASSRGCKAQESTDPAAVPWPGRTLPRERTLEGSKASKRACRLLYAASPADSRRDAVNERGNA